jgi:hypothetical protein
LSLETTLLINLRDPELGINVATVVARALTMMVVVRVKGWGLSHLNRTSWYHLRDLAV